MSVRKVLVGNWKMNKGPAEARRFIAELQSQAVADELSEMIILPPALCLATVAEGAAPVRLRYGAQNCHSEDSGAFTGENSPAVLAEMGAQFCLVGHSERRQLFGETDAATGAKVKALQARGVTPILCVGETLAEREGGQTAAVVARQLEAGLKQRLPKAPVWLAYEPVWAIGTGRVATTAQVAETHAEIRSWLKSWASDMATNTLLYGGSVRPDNAGELAKVSVVDGFLIGGASLDVNSFLAISRAAVAK